MPQPDRRLVAITGVLGVLTVVHDLDHVRQGRWLPWVLYGVAVAAVVSLALTLTVLLRRPQFAAPMAIAQGGATVIGVGVVHAAPQWSAFTDSYGAAHVDALSWAIVLAMMAAGLALAVAAAARAHA